MRELETLGLIIMAYDYKPSPTNENGIVAKTPYSLDVPAWRLTVPVNDYLKRKGYFNKRDGRPTLKLYKLLSKYNVKIPQLKKWQDEYEATGQVDNYEIF